MKRGQDGDYPPVQPQRLSRDSLKTSLHRLAIGPTRRGEAPLASTFEGCDAHTGRCDSLRI